MANPNDIDGIEASRPPFSPPYGSHRSEWQKVEDIITRYNNSILTKKPLRLKNLLTYVLETPESLQNDEKDILGAQTIGTRYYMETKREIDALKLILHRFIKPKDWPDKIKTGHDSIGGLYVQIAVPPSETDHSIELLETGEALVLTRHTKGVNERTLTHHSKYSVAADETSVGDVLTQHGLLSPDHAERVVFLVNGQIHPLSDNIVITDLERKLCDTDPSRRLLTDSSESAAEESRHVDKHFAVSTGGNISR